MGIVPIIRDVLGALNNSHGLATGLQFAARFNAAGKPVNLVNPAQSLAVLNYAVNSTDPLGPLFKSTANTGNIKLTPTIPVKNGCWTVSTLTMFPVNALDFCVLMANRTANLYHVLKNAGANQLATYDGNVRLFSPTIDIIALTGLHRLTVCGHPGGAIAYLDGVFAGSHAFVLNAGIEDFLGDPQSGTTNRAWGNSKELFAWNRTLGPGEVMEHHQDPFGMFADDSWLTWFLAVIGGGVTVSTPAGVLTLVGAGAARAGKSASVAVGILLLAGAAIGARAGKSAAVAAGVLLLAGATITAIVSGANASITAGVLLLAGAALTIAAGKSAAVATSIVRLVGAGISASGGAAATVYQNLRLFFGIGN